MIDIPMKEFVAHGEVFIKDQSAPVTFSGQYSLFDHNPVQITLFPDKSWPSAFPSSDIVTPLQVRGKSDDGDDVWIDGLFNPTWIHSGDQMSATGEANFFVKGNLSESVSTKSKITCFAYIPPTPLALSDTNYRQSHDGTITSVGNHERKAIGWSTDLGKAELIETYRQFTDAVGINDAYTRVHMSRVEVTVEVPGPTSLKEILSNLRETLDEHLWIVSFLSRKRIAWYSAESFLEVDKDLNEPIRWATAHRRIWLGHEAKPNKTYDIDLLIKPDDLREGLFQKILQNYERSPYKRVIRRALPYILMSYERGYFESHLGNAYSAIESLVDGLDDGFISKGAFILDFKRFGPLTRKLKQVITEEIQERELAKNLVRNLEKLNKSKNDPSFLDKLLHLLEKHKVPSSRLWPTGTNVKSELRNIRKRRDDYIHQGKIDNVDDYFFDLVRLRCLSEIWILTMLGCPETIINNHGLNNIVQIN